MKDYGGFGRKILDERNRKVFSKKKQKERIFYESEKNKNKKKERTTTTTRTIGNSNCDYSFYVTRLIVHMLFFCCCCLFLSLLECLHLFINYLYNVPFK